MNLTYEALLNAGGYSQRTAGTALASSVSTTDISPGGNTAGQAFTFPASYLQLGQQLRVRARGVVSNTATPNLTLGVYYGGASGTSLANTGALATASSLSNSVWELEADIRVEGTGTGGSVYTIGTVFGPFATRVSIPASAPSPVSIDTSVAKILTVAATWGTSSASNSIQVIFFTVERLDEGR